MCGSFHEMSARFLVLSLEDKGLIHDQIFDAEFVFNLDNPNHTLITFFMILGYLRSDVILLLIKEFKKQSPLIF